MTVDVNLIGAVQHLDAELRQLQDCGLDLQRCGAPSYFGKTKAACSQLLSRAETAKASADTLLPSLIDAFWQGSPEDRRDLRDLFKHCTAFMWRPEGERIAMAASPGDDRAMRRALTLFVLCAGRDWRDERLWLDLICERARAARHDLALLLRWAAEYASDQPRGDVASVRALLLGRAREEAAC